MIGLIIKLMNLFQRGTILIRLIYINVAVFFVTALITMFFQLFSKTTVSVFSFLELPASFLRFSGCPWSLFSYMFIHANFFHLLFNMLWLYWFGMLFLSFFSAKHLRGLYILGGIFGGLLYMVCYHIFPYFRSQVEYSSMVGASASVLAVVIAVAYREPDYSIRLLFFGNIRLKYIALVVVLSDLLFITSGNAGGHIAHLGGAFTGFGFVVGLNKGVDITSWINKFLDLILALFNRTTWQHKRKCKPFRKMQQHPNQKTKKHNFAGDKKTHTRVMMDDILDKLKKSGYESLTTEEKKTLFDASKR